MIISSHIITATAVTLPLIVAPTNTGNIALIFAAAFCSHYVLDLIPHWDYQLSSIKTCYRQEKIGYIKKSEIKKDFLRILIDGLLGISVSFLIINLAPASLKEKSFILFLAIIASILPDFFEVLYIFFKKQPISFLHKIHLIFHRRNIYIGEPQKGIPLQVAVISAIVILFVFIL